MGSKEQNTFSDVNYITKDKYIRAVKPAMELAISRNKKYGNSISIMKDASIIDLILMKLVRTRELPSKDKKYMDEVEDCLNYLVYMLIRRSEK